MSKHTGLLFIGFVVIAAIVVVVWVNQNEDSSVDTTNTNTVVTNAVQENSNTNTTPVDYTPVVSEDGAYTLNQPAEETVVGEITNYRFQDGNALSVLPETLQAMVLSETPVKAEEDITVSGLPGTRYTLASPKDGSLFPVVQVIYASKLYDFRGSETYLENLNDYITFTK